MDLIQTGGFSGGWENKMKARGQDKLRSCRFIFFAKRIMLKIYLETDSPSIPQLDLFQMELHNLSFREIKVTGGKALELLMWRYEVSVVLVCYWTLL